MIVLIVVNLTMKPFIFNFIWILDQDADAKQCVAESSRWYLTIWKSWKNLRLVTSAVSRGCISPSHFINFPPHWRAGCLSDETRRSYYFKSEPSISEPVANILMDDIQSVRGFDLEANSFISGKQKNQYGTVMHTCIYMWNLEKWCSCTHLQSRNGDTDVEKGHMGTAGEGKGGLHRESSVTHIQRVCKRASQWAAAVWRPNSVWHSVTA